MKEDTKTLVEYLRKTQSVKEIAQSVGVSDRLVRKWLQGKKEAGKDNLLQLKGIAKRNIGGDIADKEKIEAVEKEEFIVKEKEGEVVDVIPKGDVGVKEKTTLKGWLDILDKGYIKSLSEPYYNVTYGALMNQWEKGEKIGETVGGVSPVWRKLERETGRSHESLKKWYELYQSEPLRKKFKQKAKELAQKQTDKWIDGVQAASLPEPEKKIEEPTEIRLELETLQCMVECYPAKDRLFGDKCKMNCPRKALCNQIVTILQESPILIKERSELEKEGVKD